MENNNKEGWKESIKSSKKKTKKKKSTAYAETVKIIKTKIEFLRISKKTQPNR